MNVRASAITEAAEVFTVWISL